MSDIKTLYQELILDHNRNPSNFGKLDDYTHMEEGFNPTCGDRYNVYLKIENDVIVDIRFEGSGCAISKASASLMTNCIKGATLEETRKMFEFFHNMMTVESPKNELPEKMSKVSVLQGVKEFPARIKCATLAWHTLVSALEIN